MATHSSILAWEIPTEESGGLQPTGSQGVGQGWAADRDLRGNSGANNTSKAPRVWTCVPNMLAWLEQRVLGQKPWEVGPLSLLLRSPRPPSFGGGVSSWSTRCRQAVLHSFTRSRADKCSFEHLLCPPGCGLPVGRFCVIFLRVSIAKHLRTH